MTEWKPKYRRRGLCLPFGYFVCPTDQNLLLPDPNALEALEYSFQMRAKYKTPIRDCTMWLRLNCGKSLTPAGYLYAYRAWIKRVKKKNGHAIAVKRRKIIEERKKFLEDNYGQFSIKLDDRQNVYAVAEKEASKELLQA